MLRFTHVFLLPASFVAELTCVVCMRSKLSQLAEQVSSSPKLRIVILMSDDVTDEERQLADNAGLKVFSMKEVEVCDWL